MIVENCDTLEQKREFCSKYIRENYEEEYDYTPWWDKWQILANFKIFTNMKKNEVEDE